LESVPYEASYTMFYSVSYKYEYKG
jgi:hypothetical protein